jgi:hypothetical protein
VFKYKNPKMLGNYYTTLFQEHLFYVLNLFPLCKAHAFCLNLFKSFGDTSDEFQNNYDFSNESPCENRV